MIIFLSRKFSRRHFKKLLALSAVASVVGFLSFASALVISATNLAIMDSVLSSQGGRHYSLQVLRPEIDDVIAKTQMSPVRTEQGSISTSERRLAAEVTETRDDLPIGVLVEGSRSRKIGEVTISRYLAGAMGTNIGGTLRLQVEGVDRRVTVVGITVDPDRRDSLSLVERHPSGLDRPATIWLSSTEPYLAYPQLTKLMDNRAAVEGTVWSLAEARIKSSALTNLSSFEYLPFVALLLGLFLLTVLCVGALPAHVVDQRALVACGMSERQARSVIWLSFGFSIVAGTITGAVSSLVVVRLYKREVSGLFGQDWMSAPFPLTRTLVLLCMVLTWVSCCFLGWRLFARITARFRPTRQGRVLTLATSHSMTLFVAIGSFFAICVISSRASQFVSECGVVLALVLPFAAARAISSILFARMPRVRMLSSHLLIVPALACSVVAVAVVATTQSSVERTLNLAATDAMSFAPQPRGSLVITDTPASSAEQIIQSSRSVGISKLSSMSMPVEDASVWRATSPGLVRCLSPKISDPMELPSECVPSETSTPVAAIGLGGANVQADPGLIDSGKVGVILVDDTGHVVKKIEYGPVVPNPALGGNVPGLVVPLDSPLIEELGLSAADSRTIVLFNYDSLEPSRQAELRSDIARVAPAAQVADGIDRDRALRQFIAVLITVIGATIAGVVLLFCGLYLRSEQARIDRIIFDLGASKNVRLGLLSVYPSLMVITLGASVCIAVLGGKTTTHGQLSDIGTIWVAPLVVGIVVAIATGALGRSQMTSAR